MSKVRKAIVMMMIVSLLIGGLVIPNSYAKISVQISTKGGNSYIGAVTTVNLMHWMFIYQAIDVVYDNLSKIMSRISFTSMLNELLRESKNIDELDFTSMPWDKYINYAEDMKLAKLVWGIGADGEYSTKFFHVIFFKKKGFPFLYSQIFSYGSRSDGPFLERTVNNQYAFYDPSTNKTYTDSSTPVDNMLLRNEKNNILYLKYKKDVLIDTLGKAAAGKISTSKVKFLQTDAEGNPVIAYRFSDGWLPIVSSLNVSDAITTFANGGLRFASAPKSAVMEYANDYYPYTLYMGKLTYSKLNSNDNPLFSVYKNKIAQYKNKEVIITANNIIFTDLTNDDNRFIVPSVGALTLPDKGNVYVPGVTLLDFNTMKATLMGGYSNYVSFLFPETFKTHTATTYRKTVPIIWLEQDNPYLFRYGKLEKIVNFTPIGYGGLGIAKISYDDRFEKRQTRYFPVLIYPIRLKKGVDIHQLSNMVTVGTGVDIEEFEEKTPDGWLDVPPSTDNISGYIITTLTGLYFDLYMASRILGVSPEEIVMSPVAEGSIGFFTKTPRLTDKMLVTSLETQTEISELISSVGIHNSVFSFLTYQVYGNNQLPGYMMLPGTVTDDGKNGITKIILKPWGIVAILKGIFGEGKVTMDVEPIIDPKWNRTMVPLRFITERMGFDVKWDGNTRTITISKDNTKVIMRMPKSSAEKHGKSPLQEDIIVYPGSPVVEIYKNGQKQVINIEQKGLGLPYIYRGRTMVPLRFISETFGWDVKWDGKFKMITLLNKNQSMPKIPRFAMTDMYFLGSLIK